MLIDARFNELTEKIIGAAIAVHRHLGPGLVESAYARCLHVELAERRLDFAIERRIPLQYRHLLVENAFRVDLTVQNLVIVEIKATERLLPVHDAQLLTYLRLMNLPVGLLMNFNVPKLTDGIKRLLNAKYIGPDDKGIQT